jgi:hypothetical protein
MEDVKHYNQNLINIKEQLACILGAFQATQMEAKASTHPSGIP